MDRLAQIGAIVTDREVDRGLGGLPIKPPEQYADAARITLLPSPTAAFARLGGYGCGRYPPVSRWPLISVCEGDAEGPDRLEAVVVVDLLEGVPQIHEIHARLELPVAE